LRSAGLEAYTGLKLIMRYGLVIGNRFLLMSYEVTEVRIYVRQFGSFVLVQQARSKNYTASSSCAKSLQFRFHILGYHFNIFSSERRESYLVTNPSYYNQKDMEQL